MQESPVHLYNLWMSSFRFCWSFRLFLYDLDDVIIHDFFISALYPNSRRILGRQFDEQRLAAERIHLLRKSLSTNMVARDDAL